MTKRQIAIATPSLGEEEFDALRTPIENGWLTSGPKVREFEDLFAQIHQVNHAIAVTSATTALHLALASLGIGPGDEVIVPSFTWIATANVVLYCGARPVLVDIDRESFNISIEDLARKLTSKTKAIIPVHLFGLSADMDAIRDVAPNIPLIEDAACAAGAKYKGRYVGGLGVCGCFSFHPRKSVTTGEGGMVTTNDDELAEKLRILRNHGADISEEQRHHGPRPYLLPEFNLLGFNYRMTDLQGALGVVQLGKLESFVSDRMEWASFYNSVIEDIPWITAPEVPGDYTHAWQAYVTMVDAEKAPYDRNTIMDKLLSEGISTRPGTHAIHMLNYYSDTFGYNASDFPNSRIANDQSMAIPLHNKMSDEDFHYVAEALRNIK